MGQAIYLLRFDDVCPTMHWGHWDLVEAELDRYGLKPILAVVPENRDPRLVFGPAREDFWDRVRAWQARGWAIALHGYQHVYVNRNPGILKLAPQSEFAGLPQDDQAAKLRAAVDIFTGQGLRPDLWVAPAHSFDRGTLGALDQVGIRVISDGFWSGPVQDREDRIWIPQQLWQFREKRSGVWTICLHPNAWRPKDLVRFRRMLHLHHHRFGSLSQVMAACAPRPPRWDEDLVARLRRDGARLRSFVGDNAKLALQRCLPFRGAR